MRTGMICILAACYLFVSCATENIKGTEIPDTPTNRAVLEVFFGYVTALKEKKADKLVGLVSKNYLDHNGTDDATDDVDFSNVEAFVNSEAYQKIRAINLFFIIKDLQINKDGDTAKILYYYEVRLKTDRLAPPEEESSINSSKEKWLKETEVNQMTLKKEEDQWKIISGL
ncbi:MAG TPA: hypothetical protein PLV42_11075 [bacterium]|nr:hypothetical protein [bacterium]